MAAPLQRARVARGGLDEEPVLVQQPAVQLGWTQVVVEQAEHKLRTLVVQCGVPHREVPDEVLGEVMGVLGR